uniref:Dynein heavy chain ATP-binding dynein motor region domain-containing protein n=1 Tax=Amphimedon queenslandica TaxID=400682 RepID=A0A1X7TUD0_AMPQE
MVISDASEFFLCLRHLEKSLLTALNEVKGRILDNNRIITELETLKEEAAEVQRKMEETDTVMAEVDRVSQQYLPLSTSCSAMYFTLESLNQTGSLQMKIVAEDKLVEERMAELLQEWERKKPIHGLRALKSVLVSAGNIKRDRIQQLKQELAAQGQTLEETDLSKQPMN